VKGRTTCPKCKHEFVLDVPDEIGKHNVTCPNCNNDFIIKTSKFDHKEGVECSWEEHGEPRKTVLSAIKPRTNKPVFAAILLITVFGLGITTSVFSATFIETSFEIASGIGLEGTVELLVIDQTNESMKDVQVFIDGSSNITDSKGVFHLENVTLGLQTIHINVEGYNKVSREILVLPFFVTYNEIKMQQGTEEITSSFDTLGCTMIFAIFSVFAMLGSISCLKRQHYDVAIAGSIIGIFSFGFLCTGSIISIAAFVILMKCKEEFDDGKKGKTF